MGSRKRKGKSKKGKKRTRKPCPPIDMRPGWHDVPIGIKDCMDFKTELQPCRFMPSHRVRRYAQECKIKGRSKMGKMQLCAALGRKTHRKALSQRCGLEHMAQIYAARGADKKFNYPGAYDARVMHKILKSAGIKVTQHASRLVLKDLIVRCVAPIQEEKQRHTQALAAEKLHGEQIMLQMKDLSRHPPHTKHEMEIVKKSLKGNIDQENERHKRTMKLLQECNKAQAKVVKAVESSMPIPSAPPSESRRSSVDLEGFPELFREAKHSRRRSSKVEPELLYVRPGYVPVRFDIPPAQQAPRSRRSSSTVDEKRIKATVKREQAEMERIEKAAKREEDRLIKQRMDQLTGMIPLKEEEFVDPTLLGRLGFNE